MSIYVGFHYDDRYDPDIIKMRKRKLKYSKILFYSLSSFLFVIYSIIIYTANNFYFQIYFIFTYPLILALLWYVFVSSDLRALKYGITMTSNKLCVYGYNYYLSDIKYAEIVEFWGTGSIYEIKNEWVNKWLGIVLKNNKIILIRGTDTKDIVFLCKKIRETIGLPPQQKMKTYNGTFGFNRWKKDILGLREID